MTTKLAPGGPGRIELIALLAAMIAINAFAIDIMLPGLQEIGQALGEADENRRQLVIPAYMIGFGVLQLVFGPLADRFGRRNPLLVGLAVYVLAAASAYFVTDFNTLVALRFLQGAGAAASAVIAIALVRDLFVGDEMAKTLSLVFMVMMASPIFAPALGQFLLTIMPWQGLFGFMAGFGALVALWVFLRLPETLAPENRRAFTPVAIIEGFGIVFSNGVALAYIMGTALLFGALMGFLTSSQQIYVDHYGMGVWFPAFFAAGGAVAALGGFMNSQAVMRFGMRKLSHRALAIFAGLGALMLVLGLVKLLPVIVFFLIMSGMFFAFNFIMSNFGALAMEPLGAVAGTAASTQGFLQMVIGAALGTVIGQLYDGTPVPLAAGFVVLSVTAGAIVFFGTRRHAGGKERVT
ncbi:multidrug effflux MFS transporter [Aestuariivirga sp.]|uniref:multidrug effflux MFS transporter n=1 Tax=Aestuariivirga sp. TaxID=2650926 RepID=UPI0039E63D9E